MDIINGTSFLPYGPTFHLKVTLNLDFKTPWWMALVSVRKPDMADGRSALSVKSCAAGPYLETACT